MKRLIICNSFVASFLLMMSVPVLANVAASDVMQNKSDEAWEKNLRKQNFQDRQLIEGSEQNIFQLKSPYTAEDASIVPISLHTDILQAEDHYVKKIHIFVDRNPLPLVGVFEFTPDSGKADLAMRIRVDSFSYIRAVAEMNTGELYMVKRFIRARGACSAPPPSASLEDSQRLLGKMKMRLLGGVKLGKPNLMQVKIHHPNTTGMAPLKAGSDVIPPAFFMDTIEVTYNERPIVKALLTFGVSMDPALRFFFIPEEEGVLTIKATDTKKNVFSSTYDMKLS